MDRVRFIPTESEEIEPPTCWRCGRRLGGPPEARYLYRRSDRAIVEEWRACDCGAYQNSASVHRVTVEKYE